MEPKTGRGSGPTTVHGCACAQDRPWTLGDFWWTTFPAWHFGDPFFDLEGTGQAVVAVDVDVLRGKWCALRCDVSRRQEKKKKGTIALTLVVTHDGDNDEW